VTGPHSAAADRVLGRVPICGAAFTIPVYSTRTKKEYCRLPPSANAFILGIGRYIAVFLGLSESSPPRSAEKVDYCLKGERGGMDRGFQIIARKGAGQFRVLVFDREKRLHFPLTVFAAEAVKRSSDSTARLYLNAVIPFFEWLERNEAGDQSPRVRYVLRLIPKGEKADIPQDYFIGEETKRLFVRVAQMLGEHYRLRPGQVWLPCWTIFYQYDRNKLR
jgi:hypothetical protein